MDNDVHGTDYCIGFSTAVTRTVNFIHQLRTSAGSHERLAVVEVFGRYSGETSLVSAYLSGVDRAVICEVPFDIERLTELLMADKRPEPQRLRHDDHLRGRHHRRRRDDALGARPTRTGTASSAASASSPASAQGAHRRGHHLPAARLPDAVGDPDSLDLMVAVNYGVMAADLLLEGLPGRLVALRKGNYLNVPIGIVRQGVKRVDVDALYDVDNYRPKIRHVDGKPMFLY